MLQRVLSRAVLISLRNIVKTSCSQGHHEEAEKSSCCAGGGERATGMGTATPGFRPTITFACSRISWSRLGPVPVEPSGLAGQQAATREQRAARRVLIRHLIAPIANLATAGKPAATGGPPALAASHCPATCIEKWRSARHAAAGLWTARRAAVRERGAANSAANRAHRSHLAALFSSCPRVFTG